MNLLVALQQLGWIVAACIPVYGALWLADRLLLRVGMLITTKTAALTEHIWAKFSAAQETERARAKAGLEKYEATHKHDE